MADSSSPDSPLKSAAGAAGSHVTDAFELLGNETRLAILLALWEAHSPYEGVDAVPFSELRERVGVRDSGQFNYHLGKLVGQFVEETEEGYTLRGAGLNIVQAVIAGTGLTEETVPPTAVDFECSRCGGATEISYEDGSLYHRCTECSGYFGDEFAGDAPEGTLVVWSLNPAGVANRSPPELIAASHIATEISILSFLRGVCPTCTGLIQESLHICDAHDVEPGSVCSNCGAVDRIRVRWICSVCKEAGSFQIGAVLLGHPDITSFYVEQGLDPLFHIDEPQFAVESRKWVRAQEYELESEDPLRIGISIPGKDVELHVTLNEDLEVVEITRD